MAIPDLLLILELKGEVVTRDAMGCQKAIIRQITEVGANYVLTLTDNPPTLHKEVRRWLETGATQGVMVK